MNIDELRGQLLARVRLAGRSVRHLRKSAAESVQHPEVMDRVHDGGDLTPRFALMTILPVVSPSSACCRTRSP